MGSSHMLMLRGFELAAQMGVVYVSVNFRLGALGYLICAAWAGSARQTLRFRISSWRCSGSNAILRLLAVILENITLMGSSWRCCGSDTDDGSAG